MMKLKTFSSRALNLFSNKAFSTKSPIPVIDVEALRLGNEKEKKDVGRQIDDANREIGFFLVKNTGVDFKFMKETIDTCEKFFLSDHENKMSCRKDDNPDNKPWGYFPRNMEQLTRGRDFDKKEKQTYLNDINEQFNMQNDHYKAGLPKRIFPNYPPEFKDVFPKYWKECEQLSNLLLKGFAYGLDVPANFFEDKFDYCSSVLRVLYYPQNVGLQPGQFRASEHTDYGSLTVLYSTAPGLQVKNRKGEWLDVEVPWEHFVINIGDMMAFWSNDRWVSTPHRVISKNADNPVKRFSLAFFHNPNPDAVVECIPSCQSQSNPAKYQIVISGDFIMKKFRASIGEK